MLLKMLLFPALWPPVVFGCDSLDRLLGHRDWNDISAFRLCVLFGFWFLNTTHTPHNKVPPNEFSINQRGHARIWCWVLRVHKQDNVTVMWRNDSKFNMLSYFNVCWLLQRRELNKSYKNPKHTHFVSLIHNAICVWCIWPEAGPNKLWRVTGSTNTQAHTRGQSLLLCWLRCFQVVFVLFLARLTSSWLRNSQRK